MKTVYVVSVVYLNNHEQRQDTDGLRFPEEVIAVFDNDEEAKAFGEYSFDDYKDHRAFDAMGVYEFPLCKHRADESDVLRWWKYDLFTKMWLARS